MHAEDACLDAANLALRAGAWSLRIASVAQQEMRRLQSNPCAFGADAGGDSEQCQRLKHQFVQGYVEQHLGQPWNPMNGVCGGRQFDTWEPRVSLLKKMVVEPSVCEQLSAAAGRAADGANEVWESI